MYYSSYLKLLSRLLLLLEFNELLWIKLFVIKLSFKLNFELLFELIKLLFKLLELFVKRELLISFLKLKSFFIILFKIVMI